MQMKLYLNRSLDSHQGITDRVKDLALAHSVEPSDSEIPMIVEGSKTIKGGEAISRFLDELSEELQFWYYCRC